MLPRTKVYFIEAENFSPAVGISVLLLSHPGELCCKMYCKKIRDIGLNSDTLLVPISQKVIKGAQDYLLNRPHTVDRYTEFVST